MPLGKLLPRAVPKVRGRNSNSTPQVNPVLNIRFWDTSACPCKQWLVGTEAATENQPLHSRVSRLFETAEAGQTGCRTHPGQSGSAALPSPVLRLQVGIWGTASGFR